MKRRPAPRLTGRVLMMGMLAGLGLLGCQPREVVEDSPRADLARLAEGARGIILETAPPDSVFARAGLEAGDRLLAWERLPVPPANPRSASGRFETPFDWSLVFQEQADRGPIVLRAERDGIPEEFTVEPGLWPVRVRPSLDPERTELLAQARELLAQGEFDEGLKRLHQAFEGLSPELQTWCQLDLAQAARRAKHPGTEALYETALESAPRGDVESLVRLSQAEFLWQRGDTGTALEAIQESVDALETRGDSLFLAWHYGRLGLISWSRSDLFSATNHHRRALEISRALAPDGLRVAASLNNLGLVASDRRDFEISRTYHTEALEIRRRLAPGTMREADSLNNLGIVSWNLEERSQALEYFLNALAIYERQNAPSRLTASVRNNLGLLYLLNQELDLAETHFTLAYEQHDRFQHSKYWSASSLHNLALVAFRRGLKDKAFDLNSQSLEALEQIRPEPPFLAATLLLQGHLHRDSEPRRALEYYERSIAAAEKQVEQLGGGHESHSRFRAGRTEAYHSAMDLRLVSGDEESAFETLERYRARGFLELLTTHGFDPKQDIPEDLQRELETLDTDHERLLRRLAELDPRNDADAIRDAQRGLVHWRADRANLQARMRQVSPRLAAMHPPKALDVPQSRDALRLSGAGTALVSFAVGKDTLHTLALRPDQGLRTTRQAITQDALEEAVHALRQTLAATTSRTASNPGFDTHAAQLYNWLIAPLEPFLEGADRLLLIPDGPLHLLPFAALRREDGRFLIEWKPIHTALSATAYRELLRRRPDAQAVDDIDGTEGLELAAFGDPRFPKRQRLESESSGAQRLRSTLSRGHFRWQSLPATRDEVERIAQLFPTDRRTVFLGAEATEEEIKRLNERRPRYLHLAAHAFVDPRSPLDSALVLSIPEGLPDHRENGLLQVWEILDQLRLDADLVVLSACETGLGDPRGGDGLIGLTRAFQIAGARSVLASLWEVEDRATAELMTAFYRNLRAGKPKDEALRAAQLDLLRKGPSGETGLPPFFWAGFQLNGDWR